MLKAAAMINVARTLLVASSAAMAGNVSSANVKARQSRGRRRRQPRQSQVEGQRPKARVDSSNRRRFRVECDQQKSTCEEQLHQPDDARDDVSSTTSVT